MIPWTVSGKLKPIKGSLRCRQVDTTSFENPGTRRWGSQMHDTCAQLSSHTEQRLDYSAECRTCCVTKVDPFQTTQSKTVQSGFRRTKHTFTTAITQRPETDKPENLPFPLPRSHSQHTRRSEISTEQKSNRQNNQTSQALQNFSIPATTCVSHKTTQSVFSIEAKCTNQFKISKHCSRS